MREPDNLVNGVRVSILHGENFFRPIDKLPKGDTKKMKKFIAGHSESGHHHVLVSDKNIEVLDNERAFLLEEVGELFHQKTFDVHETKILAPGAYEITHKNEYDPFSKVVRAVYD